MKDVLLNIVKEYSIVFPEEKERQSFFVEYLKNHNDDEIIDWNNFNGHVVASGFVYSKKDNKFLVLYHEDMKMFVYPGGHIDKEDLNPLDAAKREVIEETGIHELELLKVSNNELIPIDIDTHIISYNERLNLPEHYHFDIRYLFVVDNILKVKIDNEELSSYKWISMDELSNDINYGRIANKIKKLLRR